MPLMHKTKPRAIKPNLQTCRCDKVGCKVEIDCKRHQKAISAKPVKSDGHDFAGVTLQLTSP